LLLRSLLNAFGNARKSKPERIGCLPAILSDLPCGAETISTYRLNDRRERSVLQMKKGCIFINASRGTVCVILDAVADALSLESRRPAAVDVTLEAKGYDEKSFLHMF